MLFTKRSKKLVILIQLEIEGNLNRCIHSSCDVHKWRSILLVVGLVVKSLAYNMERHSYTAADPTKNKYIVVDEN
jgi:hypothetical protein